MLRGAIGQRLNLTLFIRKTLFRVAAIAIVILFAMKLAAAQTAAPNQQAAPAKGTLTTQPTANSQHAASAQTATKQSTPPASAETLIAQELQKYPGLLPEFSHLLERLQQGVQSPAPRTASRLLPLLPASTIAYAALPNYGEVARQTLSVFRDELQQSAVLRDWWTHVETNNSDLKVEELLQRFDQLHQYLGDEIALSASMDPQHQSGAFVVLAQIRKPGLEKLLRQWTALPSGLSNPSIHVFTPEQLDSAIVPKPGEVQGFSILVRPDLVIAAIDIGALRGFNASLKTPRHEFASSPFGQQVAQEYKSGVTFLAAADVQKILSQKPLGPKSNDKAFQDSGFADMKYAVWKHTSSNGQSSSQAELSFTGPRRGAAAWLSQPAQLDGLNFVSPKAMLAVTLVLSDFSQIFDDLKNLSGPSQGNLFAAIEGGQKALKVNLKDDLLAQLAGEFTVEVDSLSPPQPVAKVIFKVNDVARLQKTLTTLLAATQIPTQHFNDSGVAYEVVRIPNQNKPLPVAYTFLDGYWIVASNPETLLDAIQLHASNGSLANSQKFLAALPPDSAKPPRASALFYQDPAATFALQARAASPELSNFLAQFMKNIPASVTQVYGEESTIKAASSSGSFDVGTTMTALVVAAVAIPNLMRSRTAANESSAVGSMRSLNTAQVTYAAMYPKRGFAPNLATLGLGSSASLKSPEDHAGLLDASLANDSCTGSAWCNKSGYQFRIITGCTKLAPCTEYLAVATPLDANTGSRSFCSTSDAVIRYKIGAPSTPMTVPQCRAWPALK